MQAPHLRPVMNAEQYQHERQRLRDLYGSDAESAEQPTAKRDQALAELFCRSGWTQEQLAAAEGKSQFWVSKHLLFGRFLAFISMDIIAQNLTERRFRSCWEQTEKTSKDNEIARFDAVIRLMQAPKAKPQPKAEPQLRREKPSPQRDKALEIVRPLIQAGLPTPPDKLHQEHGLAEISFREAAAWERGRLEGIAEAKAADALIDESILSKSQQEKFTALEKRLRARIETDVEDKVYAEVVRRLEENKMPWRDRLERADKLSKVGKPFSQAEYRDILAALHPDCLDEERRNRTFRLFKDKEILLRPEEKDRPYTSDLPSKEELLARMKAQMEARKKTGKRP